MHGMKLAIFTQPLHANYGGLLQAYALQKVLKGMGHDAWLIRFCKMEDYRSCSWMKREIVRRLKNVVRFCLGRRLEYPLSGQEQAFAEKNTRIFIEQNIQPVTPLISSPAALRRYCGEQSFEGYVVGSDQVWRPLYSPDIKAFFLAFDETNGARKVAYAASFGTDEWEFSSKEERTCRPAAQQFDAISVREDSGIELCRKHLGVEAVQTIDPTLLLAKSDYEGLVAAAQEPQSQGTLFCYLLDRNGWKQNLVDSVARELGLTPFFTQPAADFTKENMASCPERCVSPSVTAWIRSFMDAEYVLTDSFHGSVFSIIFHKPFVAIGNQTRGQSRFQALFSRLGLEKRLCTDQTELSDVLSQTIDWESVDGRLAKWREESLLFLTKHFPS